MKNSVKKTSSNLIIKYHVSKSSYNLILETTISSWLIFLYIIISQVCSVFLMGYEDLYWIITNYIITIIGLIVYLINLTRSTCFLCNYRINNSKEKPLVILGVLMFYFAAIVGIIVLTKIERIKGE